MTDPRYNDPPREEHHLSEPVRRRDYGADRMWGWIAGLAVVVLIVFIVIVGWNSGGPDTTASNPPGANAPATTTGQGPASTPAQSPLAGQSAPKPQGTTPGNGAQ